MSVSVSRTVFAALTYTLVQALFEPGEWGTQSSDSGHVGNDKTFDRVTRQAKAWLIFVE
ncbi:hypothetical protein GCM10009113_13180 [Marinobacter szutsaonensis]